MAGKASRARAGQIISRGKGVWLVRVYLGRDPETGRRAYHNKTIHGNKEEAQSELDKLRSAKNTGALAAGADRRLVGGLLDDLLRHYRDNNQSIEWAEIVVNHLRPVFGKIPIPKFSTTHVGRYIDKRRGQGRANSTINRELALLRKAFTLGAEHDPPKVGRMPKITTLKENNVRKGFFEHDQYLALRGALPDELKAMLTFGYTRDAEKGKS